MIRHNVDIPTGRVGEFCRKWKVREFSLFGSVLRGELAAMFGRDVDLVEKEGLRNLFRRHNILTTREVIYAA